MTILEKLYNKTNLEKEIKDFYKNVGEDSIGYVVNTISDKIGTSDLIIDANAIKIQNSNDETLAKLDKILYKIPGKVIVDQNSATIMM